VICTERFIVYGVVYNTESAQYGLTDRSVNGNKRTAAFTAILFLDLNGIDGDQLPDDTELEELTLGVASGRISNQDVVIFFNR